MNQFTNELRILIASDNTETVFKILDDFLKKQKRQYLDLVLLQSQWNQAKKKYHFKLLTKEEYEVELVRINQSLLFKIAEIEELELDVGNVLKEYAFFFQTKDDYILQKTNSKSNFLLWIAIFIFALLLVLFFIYF